MKKIIESFGIIMFFVFISSTLSFAQTQSEQLTITTYYPAPYGSYNELQLYPHYRTAGTPGACNTNPVLPSPSACAVASDVGKQYYDGDCGITMVCAVTSTTPTTTYGWGFTNAWVFKPGTASPIVPNYLYIAPTAAPLNSATNVGIGTDQTNLPKTTLHVKGNTGIRLESTTYKYGFINSQGNLHFTQNVYFDGSDWKSIATGNLGGFQTNLPVSGIGEVLRVFSGSATAADQLSSSTFTNHMVVRTDGGVGIGTTTPSGRLHVRNNSLPGAASVEKNLLIVGETVSGNATPRIRMPLLASAAAQDTDTDPSHRFNVTVNTATGIISTALATGSSRRYKKDIQALKDDFYKIIKAEPKSFIWKGSGAKDIGYIAEEFDELGLKDLVVYNKEGQPDSIKYDKIPLYLLEVIKVQQKEIEQLKVRLDKINK